MEKEILETADEVLESFVSHVAKVAQIEDAEVLGRIARLFAQGALRVVHIEEGYQWEGSLTGVADDLAEYLK